MLLKKLILFSLATIGSALVILGTLAVPTAAYADSPDPTPDNGTCLTCHENLYYLHDTGKYFCINESPMACVGCHGGNPQATTKEEAHTLRAAHPVINEDISKCQECHPEQCTERMAEFDQIAGFSDNVLVAGATVPQFHAEQSAPVPAAEDGMENNRTILLVESVVVVMIIALAMALYFYRRAL